MKNREYRSMPILTRAEGDGDEMIVRGHASTFDEPYELFEWDNVKYMEVVDRGAFDDTDLSDVIMQYDHHGRVFARNKNKTLEVKPDDEGLFIEANLGGTEIGRQLFEEIRGGYTDKMSFAFTVKDEMEEKEKTDEGVIIYTRHIKSVEKVYDVSAVSMPANDGTSISAEEARSVGDLRDGVIARIKAERLEEEKLELERQRAEVRARALGKGNQK